ncbi:MAG: hypothetical protein R2814_02970 [Flavobacteriaceae bacterium]
MIAQTPSRIFISAQRKWQHSRYHSCHSTFGQEDLNGALGKHLGSMRSFTCEVLIACGKKKYTVSEDTLLVLIPLVGSLKISNVTDNGEQLLAPNEIASFLIRESASYYVNNLHKDQAINYLQIYLNVQASPIQNCFGDVQNNVLHTILKTVECQVNFGVFDGRKEVEYTLENQNNGIFVFVINGVFEVQHRLLESRDALALWDVGKIELESLSENAILLVLELKNVQDNKT